MPFTSAPTHCLNEPNIYFLTLPQCALEIVQGKHLLWAVSFRVHICFASSVRVSPNRRLWQFEDSNPFYREFVPTISTDSTVSLTAVTGINLYFGSSDGVEGIKKAFCSKSTSSGSLVNTAYLKQRKPYTAKTEPQTKARNVQFKDQRGNTHIRSNRGWLSLAALMELWHSAGACCEHCG